MDRRMPDPPSPYDMPDSEAADAVQMYRDLQERVADARSRMNAIDRRHRGSRDAIRAASTALVDAEVIVDRFLLGIGLEPEYGHEVQSGRDGYPIDI